MTELKELIEKNDIKTVSLFSGAGGLDIGAIRAGAKIVWANDVKKDAFQTYTMNIGEHIHLGDLNSYIPNLDIENVDLLIGGPPCQGFSVAGKMDSSDERSKLIWSYAEVVNKLRPRAFIMENVKALAAIDRWAAVRAALIEKFASLGYSINYMVLNSSDFDVPQARERVFFVGFKGRADSIPDLIDMIKPYSKKAETVREALSVLDKAGTGNNKNTCNARITLTPTPVMRKSPYAGMLFNGLGRPVKLDGYSATLPASMGGNKTPIIDENALYNKATPWVELYHNKLLSDLDIAKTETVPQYLRRMTVDEARIIQTFPLNYEFCGSQSSQYTQIGNAVPCNLSFRVCSMVIDVLRGKSKIKYSGLFQ